MCHTSEVDTLDHYLPKSKYPSLSINPLNLIPICNKCNKTKVRIHLAVEKKPYSFIF